MHNSRSAGLARIGNLYLCGACSIKHAYFRGVFHFRPLRLVFQFLVPRPCTLKYIYAPIRWLLVSHPPPAPMLGYLTAMTIMPLFNLHMLRRPHDTSQQQVTLDNMSMINVTVFCVSTRRTVFSVANYCGGATRLYFSSIFNGELKGRFDGLRSYHADPVPEEMAIINHLILYTMQLWQASAITTESSCQTESIAICSQCAACKEYQLNGTVWRVWNVAFGIQ